jgi:pimeloyl-ACP methyl ester carboxylesterase
MVEDAGEVVQFLRNRYGKNKIFVLGHSWGSVIGISLAHAHTEWLYAYIGTANGRENAETDAAANGMKWALHLAIAAAADVSVLEPLIKLACDRRHGRNRALFVDALARIDDPRAKATLEELANDPDLAEDVRRVTKKRRQRCQCSEIRELATRRISEIPRTCARRVCSKIVS